MRPREDRGWIRLAALAPVLMLYAVCAPGSAGHVIPSAPAGADLLTPAPLSIGGGPPGGVRGVQARATPTDYDGCGPGAIPETGLQGQVPLADQQSGASKQGYRCNLRLVGYNTIQNRGANFQLGWYGNCAYVGSVFTREYQSPDSLDGVAVIDASNPRNPELVQFVRSPGGISQHEGIEVNRKRGMLVVFTGNDGSSSRYLDIYDVSDNCRSPVFKARYDAGYPFFHGLKISDDGRTIYGSDWTGAGNLNGTVMRVIDVSDMAQPRLLYRYNSVQTDGEQYAVHDLDVSRDGNRAYLGTASPSAALGGLLAGPPSNTGPTMVVLDTSEIQSRVANPTTKVISDVRLPNPGHTEQRATIDGRPYIITSGETPFGGADNCPWSWGNVVDIGDERNPKVVSQIRLEVNEQSNCAKAGPDDAVYSIHYSGVDDKSDTRLLFYTYYTGGVRVFDIRDPNRPKEIGYFHPPPVSAVAHPPFTQGDGDFQGPEWDSATSDIRYLPRKRQLWFVSIGRGFQILELTTPEARGRARIVRRQKVGRVLARRSLRIRARCTRACTMKVKLRVAGGRGGKRIVKLKARGRRFARLRLNGRARRVLARHPRARLRLKGVVKDAVSERKVNRFKTKPRRLRASRG